MKKDGYYSSGEFARMAHVTLRTIRYYDKHDILNHFGEKKPKYGYITPNFYYFCVTNELKSYVLDYLNANYPKYGLLVCDNYRQYGRKSHIYCVKRAKRIHDTPPSQRVFIRIYKRVQKKQ